MRPQARKAIVSTRHTFVLAEQAHPRNHAPGHEQHNPDDPWKQPLAPQFGQAAVRSRAAIHDAARGRRAFTSTSTSKPRK